MLQLLFARFPTTESGLFLAFKRESDRIGGDVSELCTEQNDTPRFSDSLLILCVFVLPLLFLNIIFSCVVLLLEMLPTAFVYLLLRHRSTRCRCAYYASGAGVAVLWLLFMVFAMAFNGVYSLLDLGLCVVYTLGVAALHVVAFLIFYALWRWNRAGYPQS